MKGGQDWRTAATDLFGGAGSFGNGAAMRVAPLGAFFADDLDRVVAEARRSAEVTHAHPEAVAGAVAVAAMAVLMWQLRDRQIDRAELLGQALALVPPGAVRDGLLVARDLPPETTAPEAARRLGSGSQVSCQDTVPFALWCAAAPHSSFEEAIWLTLSGLGDCDTTGAIVGGIVVWHQQARRSWRRSCIAVAAPLPSSPVWCVSSRRQTLRAAPRRGHRVPAHAPVRRAPRADDAASRSGAGR